VVRRGVFVCACARVCVCVCVHAARDTQHTQNTRGSTLTHATRNTLATHHCCILCLVVVHWCRPSLARAHTWHRHTHTRTHTRTRARLLRLLRLLHTGASGCRVSREGRDASRVHTHTHTHTRGVPADRIPMSRAPEGRKTHGFSEVIGKSDDRHDPGYTPDTHTHARPAVATVARTCTRGTHGIATRTRTHIHTHAHP
jgi:hypothetical protein